MSFEPPAGILDIGNATLRVGKLEVAETSGLNQGLLNIVKNNILINENIEYPSSNTWGIKLPTTWVAEFDVKGHSGKYIDFNFYNENSASNAQGYNLTFKDTTMTLRYDNGNPLGGGAATIPTIVGAFRKVNIFFERGVISVSIDGTRYLYHKETDGFNQGLGVASRVVSTTGSAFVNVFIEETAANSKFKNLRIVNGRFISDKTSNIAFIGGNLGVGVNSPKEALDIRGNMHFNRVSNVSSVSVDSNVVTEYTGPHDRPLRKYPEVELDVNAMTSPGVGGYIVAHSGQFSDSHAGWNVFGEEFTTTNAESSLGAWIDSNPGSYAKETADAHNGVVGSITTAVQTAGTLKLASNTPVGAWISLELPTSIKLQRIEMRARLQHASETDLNEVALQSFPREFGIWGYDGSNWVLLKSVTGHSANSVFGYTPTHVNATTAYNKYAIVVTRTNAVGGSNSDDKNFTAIGQLYFYGHEEGSGSLDTTLKTVYNVPATTGTQLEVYYDAKDLTTMSGNVTDLAGGDQNGTVTGATLDETGGIESFAFNGVNQTITLSDVGISGGQALSMSGWLKVNSAGEVARMGIGTYTAARCMYFTVDNSVGTYYIVCNAHNNVYTGTFTPNTWIHVNMVYTGATYLGGYISGTTLLLYINGKIQTPSTPAAGTTPLNLPSPCPLRLGRGIDGGYTAGSIANFRLFNRALTSDEIYQLYAYQKEYFGHGDLSMTLKAGRLGIGTSEPRAALDVRGDVKFSGMPNMTESIFFYIDGNAGDNYPNYQNTHAFYQNKFIPPGIGSYGVDQQWYTTSQYTSTTNDLFKSHFDTMVYWLKNAPIGHVHKLNWVTNNNSCHGTTFGQKNNGTQIRLWGYFPAYNTGYNYGHNKLWNDALIFNMSSATELVIFYDGYTISN